LISDLRGRVHTQGNGLHGRGTTPHAAERNTAHVQGRWSVGEQAASKTLATAVDDRHPGRDDLRPGCIPEFQQELAGRAAGLLQRRAFDVAQLARENRGRGDGRAFLRASQITAFRDYNNI
jgi:hypothetical protein